MPPADPETQTRSPAPQVSVILPCFDVVNCIGAAIDSLRKQDFTDFEAIVIDDGSTDGTATEARRAIGGDTRFRLVSQPNRGLSCARNAGLDMARGAYVAFLDADDWLAPGFLSRMLRELGKSGADWAACAVWLEGGNAGRFPHAAIHGAPEIEGAPRLIDLADACTIARHFPSAWNKLYRRDFVADLRFEPGALYEDHAFYWALACRSDAIWYVPEPLYHHRRNRPGQITSLGTDRIFQQFARLDTVRAIVEASSKTNTRRALSQIATRLVHERLQPVSDPTLRAAFTAKAQEYFTRHGLAWDWAGSADIDLRLGPRIDPALRYTVLVLGREGQEATRAALHAQRLPPTQIMTLPETGLSGAWPEVDTDWCAILRAGDRPGPEWAARMMQALHHSPNAQWAVGTALLAPDDRLDPGFALPLLPCADLAACLVPRHALARVPHHGPGWLASLRLHELGLPAVMAHGSGPSIRLAPRATCTPRGTIAALRALISDGNLTAQDAAAVFAHRAQLAVLERAGRVARLMHACHWGAVRRASGLPKPPRAAHLGPKLRRIL